MPAPTSINEFIDLTQKSGVVDENRLNNYVQQLRNTGQIPKEPVKLAGLLIRDGLLTKFQAEQLMMGKWKRFAIGKYKILEKLGHGGMGQVFLCEHKIMKRRVAVKVLPTAQADQPSSLDRFYREAKVVASLDHVNIVRAYDIDQDDSGASTLHFLVMEFVDGPNLQDVIKNHGPMDPLRACHYVRQAALGLQHAFDAAGVIHRDIKPGNVLVDRQGVVKILDMGLARFFHDNDDLLTKQYDETVLGTADYLAPEQAIDSHNVDIRADIYSLGATFYFMLTGLPPFPDGTIAQKLVWHGTKEPAAIRTIRPDVPAEVVAVIEKMMAKDKAARYQKPMDVADALAPLTTTPIPPPPESEMPRWCAAALGLTVPSQATSTTLPKPTSGLPSPAPAARSAAPAPPRTPAPRPAPRAPTFETAVAPPPPVPPPPATAAIRRSDVDTAESPPIWASIASETPTAASGASGTKKYRPAPRPVSGVLRSGKPTPAATQNQRTRWLLFVAAGVVLGIVVIGAMFAFGVFSRGKGTTPEPNTGPPAGPQRLVVDTSANPEASSFKSVATALMKARAGDRIIVRGPAIEEPEWTNVANNRFPANVTVEAENAPMPWRLAASARDHKAVLTLANMDGLKFKGFAFDGQGKAENGIYVLSRCPGVSFEDCHVQNCKDAAVKLTNATGEESRPITFSRMRLNGTASSKGVVYLFAAPNHATIKANQHVVFDHCLFDGSGNSLALIEGSAEDVTFSHCVFANAGDGLTFRPQRDTRWAQINVLNNAFAQLRRDAIQIDTSGAAIEGKTIAVRENQFISCKNDFTRIGSQPLPELNKDGNIRDAATGEGNGGLATKVGPVKMPADVPNPK
jgi:serine/threonine protein kinase